MMLMFLIVTLGLAGVALAIFVRMYCRALRHRKGPWIMELDR